MVDERSGPRTCACPGSHGTTFVCVDQSIKPNWRVKNMKWTNMIVVILVLVAAYLIGAKYPAEGQKILSKVGL